jgi:hypothetical protein
MNTNRSELDAVVRVLNGWVSSGIMSRDFADRYIADYMVRHGILDLTVEPLPMPSVMLDRSLN